MFAGEIAAKHGNLQQVSGERGPMEARSCSGRVDPVQCNDLGEGENAVERGVGLGLRRHMRQLTTAMRARNFASLSAVSSFASSVRQPDFMTLWNTSAFQRSTTSRASRPPRRDLRPVSWSPASSRSARDRAADSLRGRGCKLEPTDCSASERRYAPGAQTLRCSWREPRALQDRWCPLQRNPRTRPARPLLDPAAVGLPAGSGPGGRSGGVAAP